MKKILAAVLAMGMGASVFAAPSADPTLVYDYRATFKRIDARYQTKQLRGLDKKNYSTVTNMYNVVSDSIRGYIVLPPCVQCDPNAGVVNFSNLDLEEGELYSMGYAYLTRQGDRYAKRAKEGVKPFVLKTKVKAYGTIFGAPISLQDIDEGLAKDEETGLFTEKFTKEGIQAGEPLKNIRDARRAWLDFKIYMPDFSVQQNQRFLETKNVNSHLTNMTPGFAYGFYGIDNTKADKIRNKGFGSAKVLNYKEAANNGWCDNESGTDVSCMIFNTLNGSMMGDADYFGLCNVTPMWDLCYDGDANYPTDVLHQAGVAGTWTLRYNSSLSNKDKFQTLADKEKEIYKRLGIDGKKITADKAVMDISAL